MLSPTTPFPMAGYFGNKYFCDRESEKNDIIRNFKSGVSTTLVSLRRLGKTALINHVGNNLTKGSLFLYIDIQATGNLNDFLNLLAAAVVHSVPEKSSFGKKVLGFFHSLRPVMSFNQLTGSPEFTFDIQYKEVKAGVEGIINLLENHNERVLIAIDEFQQIIDYPEDKTDAWLRGIIQKLKNVSFIFSGSKQHIMTELFNHPSKPFYRSTNLLKLEKISEHHYSSFIKEKFTENKMRVTDEVVKEILEWTERYTYYVQLLCGRVYLRNERKIITDSWKEEAYKLLKEQEPVFYNFRELLTSPQWTLLKAIARENQVTSPTAKDFISEYKLGSSAAVLRSLNSLVEKEMVYYDFNEQGEKYYKVYDLLLKKWLEQI